MNRKQSVPRVVVVTGASAGVGRAVAREYARRGATVGLLARNADALTVAKAEVDALGGRGLVLPVDVADSQAVESAADQVTAAYGPIDVWVNNAMVTVVSPVALLDAEEIRRVTEVTYLGAVHGTLAALRGMLPRDDGVIVQVGSALAYRSIPLQAAYCGAKFALRGFTDSLRSELLHQGSGVHVTMVHLPALNTPQFDWCRTRMTRTPRPVAPVFQPEVAARAIAWAATHRRRELHLGSATVAAIWVNKLLPGLLDRYLARTGVESQLSNRPVDAERRDNLWQPVPGDHGAHGRFDSEAVSHSTQLRLTTHRPSLAAASLAGLGILGIAAYRRMKR